MRKARVAIPLAVALVLIGLLAFYFWPAPLGVEDKIAMDVLKNTLDSKYVPQSIKMVNRLTAENQANGDERLYGLTWYIGDENFYASILYNDLSKSAVSSYKIFILANDIPDELSEGSASSIFNRYFNIQSQAGVECSNATVSSSGASVTWCESFWEDASEGKMGMVVVSAANNKFVGFCEYPKGSEEYGYSTCMQTANN